MDKVSALTVFEVDGQLFGIPVDYVQSILQLPKIFKVPQAPEYIMGVVNVAGEVIPLLNAGQKLGMEPVEANPLSTILVVERHEEGSPQQRLALLIDEVKEVIEVKVLHKQSLPTSKYSFDERLVDGMFPHEEDFVMQIHVTNFFQDELEGLVQHVPEN